MNPHPSSLFAVVALGCALFIGSGLSGCSSESTSSSSSSKYSCKLNGNCMKCPSADDVSKCGTGQPHACTSTDDSFCE